MVRGVLRFLVGAKIPALEICSSVASQVTNQQCGDVHEVGTRLMQLLLHAGREAGDAEHGDLETLPQNWACA